MKKILIAILAFCFAAPFVWAVPADPTPYKYVQPDGSVIVLQNHGDEFFHWTTDATGQVVKKMADGFYRPVEINMAAEAAKAEELRARMNAFYRYDTPPVTNFGDRKVLCLLANFTDISYTVANPKEHFSNMLNQVGYSEGGSIGSVRDYFMDNSGGQYRPQFDVYGPVPLANPSQYYDTEGVSLAIMEAYSLLEEEININDYDTDNDGNIDMVLFYFPGYNEAEGGDSNTIWPHQSSGYMGDLGSKHLVRYFCTSEFRGSPSSGQNLASIGTTCHEFSHSLGLPDFYDADYANSGGQNSTTTSHFDLMASGNYNDAGRKPPYLSAVERYMLGWAAAPTAISNPGNYSLEPVQNDKAYQFDAATAGESFVLEYRNGNKWDSAIPTGLLVYHIDQSERIIDTEKGRSAAYLWERTNAINNYYGHPCYYLVPSVEGKTNDSYLVFPGTDNVTTYIPTDWDANPVGMLFTNIAHDGTSSTFTLSLTTQRRVFGVVRDTDGNPIPGVQVSLTPSDTPFYAAPSLLAGSVFCMTDATGAYSLDLGDTATEYQILTAQKVGYVSWTFNETISSLFTEHDITMLRQGEGSPVDLYKYDSSAGGTYWGFGTGKDIAVSMHFTAEELAARNAVGALIKNVTFYTAADQGESIYVIVDIEGETSHALCRNVTAQYTPETFVTVDISDANIIIPDGKGIYIGYGIEQVATTYPFCAYGSFSEDHGGLYRCYGFLGSSYSWSGFKYHNSSTDSDEYYDAFISANLATTADVEFSTLGVSYIKVEGDVPTVRVAAGKSLKSTAWYVDGASVSAPTAVSALAAGSHTYMVRLTYYDGSSERVYYDVEK